MSLGQRLSAAREACGVSIEELARRTRIPAGRLRALEADAFDRLPQPVFIRGYLRACARELALDPSRFLDQYESEAAVHAAVSAVAEPLPPAGAAPEADGRWRSLIVAAGGVLLIVAAVWSIRGSSDLPAPAGHAVSGAVQAPQPVGTTGSASHAPFGDLSLIISAERVCWVTAAADGRRAVYRLMQPGDREVVRARERIELRIGDAGAVTLSVNDGAPQAAGADGAVRTLLLTAGAEPHLRDAPAR